MNMKKYNKCQWRANSSEVVIGVIYALGIVMKGIAGNEKSVMIILMAITVYKGLLTST